MPKYKLFTHLLVNVKNCTLFEKRTIWACELNTLYVKGTKNSVMKRYNLRNTYFTERDQEVLEKYWKRKNYYSRQLTIFMTQKLLMLTFFWKTSGKVFPPPPLPYLFFPVTFLTFSFKSLPQCCKIARSQLMPARN